MSSCLVLLWQDKMINEKKKGKTGQCPVGWPSTRFVPLKMITKNIQNYYNIIVVGGTAGTKCSCFITDLPLYMLDFCMFINFINECAHCSFGSNTLLAPERQVLLLLSLNYQWRNRSKWTVWPSGSSYTSILLVCPIWILKLLGLVVVAPATCSFWPKLYGKSSHTTDTTVWCTQLFFALSQS